MLARLQCIEITPLGQIQCYLREYLKVKVGISHHNILICKYVLLICFTWKKIVSIFFSAGAFSSSSILCFLFVVVLPHFIVTIYNRIFTFLHYKCNYISQFKLPALIEPIFDIRKVEQYISCKAGGSCPKFCHENLSSRLHEQQNLTKVAY